MPSGKRKIPDHEPCSHKGCLSHVTHPCEGCGRIQGESKKEKKVIIDGPETFHILTSRIEEGIMNAKGLWGVGRV